MEENNRRYVLSLRISGIGDRLICLCAAWKYAKDTQRILIADWRHSIYRRDGGNLFVSCFEPRPIIGGVEFIASDDFDTGGLPRPIYPSWWQFGELIARPWDAPTERFLGDPGRSVELIRSRRDIPEPTVVFNACINDGIVLRSEARTFLEDLKPVSRISDEVESFLSAGELSEGFIGVHVRHGNGGNIMGHAASWISFDAAINRVVTSIAYARSRAGHDAPVLLCTDSADVEQALKGRVTRLFCRSKEFRESGAGELHRGSGAEERLNDALIEMFLLARSRVLVRYPGGSFFSFYAAVMKQTVDACPTRSLYDLQAPWDARDHLAPAVLF